MKHSGNKSNINKYDKILMFLQIIDIIFVIVQISIFKNIPLYINIIMTVISIPLALLIIVYTIVSYIKSKKLYDDLWCGARDYLFFFALLTIIVGLIPYFVM